MQCMKCGRDLDPGEVFCRECRDVMARYPVKPGTVVQLPHRQLHYTAKRQPSRRKAIPLEEQIERLKHVSRRLALALLVSVLISAVAGYVAVTQFLENHRKHAVGQNYSVMTTEATNPATETTETPTTVAPTTEASNTDVTDAEAAG